MSFFVFEAGAGERQRGSRPAVRAPCPRRSLEKVGGRGACARCRRGLPRRRHNRNGGARESTIRSAFGRQLAMCVVRQLTSLGKPAGVSRSVRRRSWSWRASAEERVEEEECNRAPPAPPTFPAIGRSAANDAPSEKGTDIGMGTVRVAITILAGEGAIAGQGLLCGGRGRKGERGVPLSMPPVEFFFILLAPECDGRCSQAAARWVEGPYYRRRSLRV